MLQMKMVSGGRAPQGRPSCMDNQCRGCCWGAEGLLRRAHTEARSNDYVRALVH